MVTCDAREVWPIKTHYIINCCTCWLHYIMVIWCSYWWVSKTSKTSFKYLFYSHQQPTIVDISKLPTQGWPCSLKWSISSFGTWNIYIYLVSLLTGYLLTVGCTSGEVIGLHWNTLTTPISCLLNLWSIIDNVAVDHMILTPPTQVSLYVYIHIYYYII